VDPDHQLQPCRVIAGGRIGVEPDVIRNIPIAVWRWGYVPGGRRAGNRGVLDWHAVLIRGASPPVTSCISGWVCHAVRAPGSNVTLAPSARAGAGAWNKGSIRTVPACH